MTAIHPQFITDTTGKKISAIIPIEEFELLLEELEDIKLYDESKRDKEPAVSKTEAMAMIEVGRRRLGK